MAPPEGRAPAPRGGDPNVREVRLSLTPDEWRQLRLWAAQEGTDTQRIVEEIVRRELEGRPRQGF